MPMRRLLRLSRFRLWRACDGASAVEFGLLLPFLITLLFGVFEIGRLLDHYHTIEKSVQDATRYLSRSPLATQCPTPTFQTTPDHVASARNLAIYGAISATGLQPLLYYWTNPISVAVAFECATNTGGTLYRNAGDVPVVKVTANVTYDPLVLDLFGLNGFSITVVGESRIIGE
jgi:Flp pilus assembly protein TadG